MRLLYTFFVGTTVKLQEFVINEPGFYHRSMVATDSTSWDLQARTRDTLWRQRYVTTSKEYLINSHILLKYFELVFPQPQLVKISWKLVIIWVNYERKRGLFYYETPCRWRMQEAVHIVALLQRPILVNDIRCLMINIWGRIHRHCHHKMFYESGPWSLTRHATIRARQHSPYLHVLVILWVWLKPFLQILLVSRTDKADVFKYYRLYLLTSTNCLWTQIYVHCGR